MDAGRGGPVVTSLPPPLRTLPVSPWSLGRPHMQPREPEGGTRLRPIVPR
jgi:hypothetical protein